MKRILLIVWVLSLYLVSCSSGVHNLFNKSTAHEKYADKIERSGLDDTPEGRAWLAASNEALTNTYTVHLPYTHKGRFPKDKPRALGLEFKARQGERLIFQIERKPGSQVIFADVFLNEGSKASHQFSVDTSQAEFSLNIQETGNYILRLQPELNQPAEYVLDISKAPSLGFPIEGPKARTGSFWGADRDGGKRKHEGIDIFAPKLTPVVAVEDGYITGVRDGGIGGKTVWMRIAGQNISAYYAHLDKQLVSEGQAVKKGEVLGLVGNTGNAKTTAPHLHFGIYTYQGPVDPFPFVDKQIKKAPKPPANNLAVNLTVKKKSDIKSSDLNLNTVLQPLAINSQGYVVQLEDGRMTHANSSSVKIEKQVDETIVTMPLPDSSRQKKS